MGLVVEAAVEAMAETTDTCQSKVAPTGPVRMLEMQAHFVPAGFGKIPPMSDLGTSLFFALRLYFLAVFVLL